MKKALKWAGILIAGLVVLAAIAALFFISKGKSAASKTHEVTAQLLSETPSDSSSLAQGMHLSKIHACQECHGESFEGKVFVDAPPFLVVASNLTSGKGGIGGAYDTGDWDRAIRHGVKPSGKAVMLMPAKTFHNLTDADTARLIAYLKSLPSVDNELPASELRTLGNVLAGIGAFDTGAEVHTESARKAMSLDATSSLEDKGKYLSSITCIYCHGNDLRGAPPLDPSMPPAPDLAAVGAWSFDMFEKTMRTGVTPTDHEINPEFMPWQSFKHMTEEELLSIHTHLKTISF